ncbi:Hint domain-containing protein [Asaia sp. BMEF1]|uniref:Hint domain-containing protein n=1 Tax=Asaia sp. BMEF1 TaxID=3155932 RepID=UPI003F66263C
MAHIVKWSLPSYKTGPGGKIISLGISTLHVDFDRKRYQIAFADGTTVNGKILTYYSGGSYQAWGMIGLGTQTDLYMFGTNSAFYPGYLTYTFLGNNGLVWLPQPSGIGPVIKASDAGFSSANLPAGQKVSAICYLPGTMITTPQGARAIEALRPGDTVIAWTDGIAQHETIIWTGKARHIVDVLAFHDDCAGYPVCFLKGSLGNGTPDRDLFVTPEHCLHIDRCFVPARMLVNGKTIFFDKTITAYDYHHIELERHAVIQANGAASESYLDTGNRLVFEQDERPDSHSQSQICPYSWENDACAPLTVAPEFVKPIWERLSPLSAETFLAQRNTTRDPDLHLLDNERGLKLLPYRRAGKTWLFRVPNVRAAYTIASNHARPCNEFGPFIDDRLP